MSSYKHKIIATITNKKGVVVAKSTNSYSKTHPTQSKYATKCGEPYKVFLHAEIAAIIKAKGQGYKIKVERFNKHGNPLPSKPCPICELAIKEAGIKIVEYHL